MYWRAGKGVEEGSWHGPGKLLMIEGQNLVWISHLTRLFRCAPEHIRKLSTDEARGVSPAAVGSFQLPSRSGTGVFQFRELSQQTPPPNTNGHTPETRTPEPDTVIEQSTNVPGGTEMHHGQTPSVGQPDAEPQCPGGESSLPSTPHEPVHDPAVETPVPVETDDDLVAITHNRDYWEIKGSMLVRQCHTTSPNVFSS